MRPFVVAMLLVLASPAFAAGPALTAAQQKDIRELKEVFFRCGGTDADDWYDPPIKKACARSRKLQEKLTAQGFCFYKRIEVGRSNKAKDDCEPL